MKSKKGYLVIFIVFLISVGFFLYKNVEQVSAVLSSPTPVCNVKGDIKKIKLIESYITVCPNGSKITMPSRQEVEIKVKEVETVQPVENKSCEQIYSLNSKVDIEIVDYNVDLTKKDNIDAVVRFKGDECESGHYVSSYTLY